MQLPHDWSYTLAPFCSSNEGKRLSAFIDRVYREETVLPAREHLFTALELCRMEATRVVILGQDPYPTPGHAHGLAFSVQPPTPPPPSLKNILREVVDDVGETQIHYGDLRPWARQGVLLLNAILTVRAGASLAHAKCGWEAFTDTLIQTLSAQREGLIFLLWGNYAKQKLPFINTSRHTVLTAAHPSPLSARNGFFGCRHFSQVNQRLRTAGQSPIQW